MSKTTNFHFSVAEGEGEGEGDGEGEGEVPPGCPGCGSSSGPTPFAIGRGAAVADTAACQPGEVDSQHADGPDRR